MARITAFLAADTIHEAGDEAKIKALLASRPRRF